MDPPTLNPDVHLAENASTLNLRRLSVMSKSARDTPQSQRANMEASATDSNQLAVMSAGASRVDQANNRVVVPGSSKLPANMSLSATPYHAPKTLLAMPKEVLDNILVHLVHDHPITPIQVSEGANKFVWGAYEVKNGRKVPKGNKPAMLAMMTVCKRLYFHLQNTAAFYKLNEFKFLSADTMLAYLASITPGRIRDLRKITVSSGILCPFGSLPVKKAIFTLLSSCVEINEDGDVIFDSDGNVLPAIANLKVIGETPVWYSSNFNYPPLFRVQDPFMRSSKFNIDAVKNKKLFMQFRCKEIEFKRILVPDLRAIGIDVDNIPDPYKPDLLQLENRREKFENEFKDILTLSRAKLPTEQELTDARILSKVLIHGDSRLEGKQLTPLLSSRTRAGQKRKREINEDGAVPAGLQPKMNAVGSLLWDIMSVLDHRIIEIEDSPEPLVELKVEWSLPAEKREGAEGYGSGWEDADLVLTNQKSFHPIDYYFSGRTYGRVRGFAQKCLNFAKIVEEEEAEGGPPRKKGQPVGNGTFWVRRFANRVSYSEKAIKKQEEKAAAKAAKDAAKAAAKAAKRKAKDDAKAAKSKSKSKK